MYLSKTKNKTARIGIFSTVGLIAVGGLLAPSMNAANAAYNHTGDSEESGHGHSHVQSLTVSPSATPAAPLVRDSYSVVNLVEEARKEAVASPAGLASFLQVSVKSTALHEPADGTVTYPIAFWNYEPENGGFHIPSRPDHNGVDFPILEGNNIYSIADGVVTAVATEELGDGYGNRIEVTHTIGGKSVVSLYAHMVAPTTFAVGDKVTRGKVLGHVGNTGRSTGPHLHFELRVAGELQDPASWLELNALR